MYIVWHCTGMCWDMCCDTVLGCFALHCTVSVLFSAVVCSAVMCSSELYCSLQYYAVLCFSILYCSVLLFKVLYCVRGWYMSSCPRTPVQNTGQCSHPMRWGLCWEKPECWLYPGDHLYREGNVLTSRNWFSLFSLFHVRNVSMERVTGTVASHTNTLTHQLLASAWIT